MQALKTLRRRISSVKSTMKITRALKLISSSKLRKEQLKTVAARNFSDELKRMALIVAAKDGRIEHPAFVLKKETKKSLMIILTTDGGFCGALNDQMAKQTEQFVALMKSRDTDVRILLAGKRGIKTFKKYNIPFEALDINIKDDPNTNFLDQFTSDLLSKFLKGEMDQILIAYNKFISIVTQQMLIDMFLPIWVKEKERPYLNNKIEFIYEPSKDIILNGLVERSLIGQFNQAIAEARTSEFAARMVAMDKAMNNARDVIDGLTRQYNRARQAAITKELLDIVGGAEALKV